MLQVVDIECSLRMHRSAGGLELLIAIYVQMQHPALVHTSCELKVTVLEILDV